MQSDLTDAQRKALEQNGGFVESGDVVFMRVDIFRDMLGFTSDAELRKQLQIGFDQADRGQYIDWNPDTMKQKGRDRLQKRSETV